MACSPEVLRGVPLFSNLDDDELHVLAGQVELRQFAARQRIFRISDPGERAYIVVSGEVRVTVLDEDQQEIVLQEPRPGDYFGFASMLEQTPHQAEATAVTEVSCIERDGPPRLPEALRATAPCHARHHGLPRPPASQRS